MPGKRSLTARRRVPELPAPPPERYAEASALAELAPRPACSGPFRFGTAGWADPALSRGELFYPKQVRTPETRLRYYAQHFPIIEVDATFYAVLTRETVARWVEWTPEGFAFDVKAHPIFSGHPLDVARLPSELARLIPKAVAAQSRVYPDALPAELRGELEQRFFSSLEPLLVSGRLKSVLLQFPPWFEATRGSARYLERLRERYPSAPFTVEFRHKSWLETERRERVMALLRAQRFPYVVVDEPDVQRAGVPPLPLVSSTELAVVRFHGQNAEAWHGPRASLAARFNYLYSHAELSAWTERLRVLADQCAEVHAVFTNGRRNYAILNAKGLCALLNESERGHSPSGQ